MIGSAARPNLAPAGDLAWVASASAVQTHFVVWLEIAALAEHPAFELGNKGCYDLGWRYDSSIVHDRADGGIFAGA